MSTLSRPKYGQHDFTIKEEQRKLMLTKFHHSLLEGRLMINAGTVTRNGGNND